MYKNENSYTWPKYYSNGVNSYTVFIKDYSVVIARV